MVQHFSADVKKSTTGLVICALLLANVMMSLTIPVDASMPYLQMGVIASQVSAESLFLISLIQQLCLRYVHFLFASVAFSFQMSLSVFQTDVFICPSPTSSDGMKAYFNL